MYIYVRINKYKSIPTTVGLPIILFSSSEAAVTVFADFWRDEI